MAENVRVVVRCRPMNNREHQMKCRNIVEIENCSVSVQNPSDPHAPAKTFTFDNVYGAVAPTESLYNDICYSLVDNVLEGYNGTIFAYGQTGCGKTHTMQGPDLENCENNTSASNSQRGIISRTFDHIFEAISVASGVRYLALVSYLEIYNENIRDLLNPNEGINANHSLKELPGLGVTVPTVSTHTVHDANECNQLLHMGNRNRMVGATLMNATSSRSHSIFTISLEQIHNVDGASDNDATIPISGIRRGKLNLVDLAGSERQNKTGAIGERLKEATKINLSLSALGNVISALVDGKTKHIPYRDSKLTRLLQDSLGGNTKTLMISCISPADNNYDETISTLRYASRAKNISNKPRINEDPKDAKIREYQEEIIKLKQLLNTTNINDNEPLKRNSDTSNPIDKWVSPDSENAPEAMNKQIERLKAQHKAEQMEKEQQMDEMKVQRQNYEQQLKQLTMRTAGPDIEVNNETQAIRKGSCASETSSELQMEARKRIEMIKKALIGGERANDMILKELRQKKKLDAQRRLSALAHALSRVEESEDRDLLQGHYTNIKQELNAKNEYLKAYRHKIKALEREVSDLQSEFQLDRADYLETIRRHERNLKFYHQLIEKALPILRKDGKYWDPNEILQNSLWNDDLKVWKLPEASMNTFKLPPATNSTISSKAFFDNGPAILRNAPGTATLNETDEPIDTKVATLVNETADKVLVEDGVNSDIVRNYFRSNRQHTADYARQKKGISYWKDFAWRQSNANANKSHHRLNDRNSSSSNRSLLTYNNIDQSRFKDFHCDGHILSSMFLRNDVNGNGNDVMNKTWSGIVGGDLLLPASMENKIKTNLIDGTLLNTRGTGKTLKALSPSMGREVPNSVIQIPYEHTGVHTNNDFIPQKRPHRLSAMKFRTFPNELL